jgi:centrin-1
MIADLDYDNREVEFDEFLGAIIDKLGDKETKEGINKIFDLFDEDNSGTINLANLKKVAKELGETMTNDELAEMLERAA